MRRVVVIVGVLVTCLGLFPARADAFWWNWIDDLSGPRFGGWTVNWRVWCRTDSDGPFDGEARIRAARKQLSEAALLEKKLSSLTPAGQARKDLLAAAKYGSSVARAEAAGALSHALAIVVNQPERPYKPTYAQAYDAAIQNAIGALRLVSGALSLLKRDETADDAAILATTKELNSLKASDDAEMHLNGFPGGGFGSGGSVELSLCSLEPGLDTKSYLSANLGWGAAKKARYGKDGNGQDIPDDDSYLGNSIVTLGVSYHSVVSRSLTIGTGGGVAVFSSPSRPTFSNFYLEPWIVDVRPLRLIKPKKWFAKIRSKPENAGNAVAPDSQKPSGEREQPKGASLVRDMVAIRYSGLVFPTGFAQGRFTQWADGNHTTEKVSPQFPAEFVQSIGIHVDLVPLLMKIHDKVAK
ncbi:MAG: hypothetical protein U0Q55_08495 [Vicinamibacterales bacterium]